MSAVLAQSRFALRRAVQTGLLTIVAGAIGYAMNSVPVYLVPGAALVFGGVVTSALALRRGALWGALAAALAFLPAVFLLEQPAWYVLATAEASLIGTYRRERAERLHALHFRYWLLLVAPALLFWSWRIANQTLADATVVAILGLSSALISLGVARLGLTLLRTRSSRYALAKGRVTMREHLLGALGIALVAPALVLLLGLVYASERSALDSEARTVRETAVNVGQAVREVLASRLAALEGIGAHLERQHAVQPELARQLLQDFGPRNLHFSTMLVTDADGNIVAGFAQDTAVVSALTRRGLSVADRAYFRVAKQTQRPYVSDPFIGRGFGSDRIVALSVPVYSADRRFLGIVEGSIRSSDFAHALANQPQHMQVAVLSQQRRVTNWSLPAEPTLLSFEAQLPPLVADEVFLPSAGARPAVRLERMREPELPSSEQWHLVATSPLGYGWRVVAYHSVADAFESLRQVVQLVVLLVLVAMLLLRLALGGALRSILEPLELLTRAAGSDTDEEETIAEPVGPRLPPQAPIELAQLAQSVDDKHNKLALRLAQLQETVAQRDGVNAALENASRGLDRLVRERTAQLEAALHDARKATAAKAEFLASMSHELRTPLNAVVGAVESLQEGVYGELDQRQHQTLGHIDTSARHLLALIANILDMEKVEAGRLQVRRERIEVRGLLERVHSTLRPLADSAGVSVAIKMPEGALSLDGDSLRLQQVLLNVVGNAVKFTPAGGSVTLRVQTGLRPGRVERIEVEDSGIGIPEEQHQRVFEPFAQVDGSDTKRFGGTGLGLALSRGLCVAMGMRLHIVRSTPAGTVFAVETRATSPAA